MSKRDVGLVMLGVAIGAAAVAGTVAACVAVKKAKDKKAALEIEEEEFDLLEEEE